MAKGFINQVHLNLLLQIRYGNSGLLCGWFTANSRLFYFRYNPPTPTELKSSISSIPPDEKEDTLLNYGLQVIQLGVFLIQLNDTEAEGDWERSIIHWKMLMLYYRCRSGGMKYAYKAMRFITSVRALYTEKMSHRIIHGQFVNPK